MRIQKYSVIIDDDYKNKLIKDFSVNYRGNISRLDTAESIVQVVNDVFYLNEKAEEYVYLLCMTIKGKPISFFEVSHGTHNMALVGGREIMIRALLCGASNIVLIHNHPSGEAIPSKEDLAMTKKIKEISDLIGIGFCDHIIIGHNNMFSFHRENLL